MEKFMKQIATIMILFGIIICTCSLAHAEKEIQVTYINGLRIPCHEIRIEITEDRTGGCSLHVTTKQMEGKTGFENKNKDVVMKIEQKYLDDIYNRLLNLNYKKIVDLEDKLDSIGLDGTRIQITVGSNLINIGIDVFSPDYDTEERKLSELNQIIKDIFTKAGIIEWY
jgi:hypothetical protein